MVLKKVIAASSMQVCLQEMRLMEERMSVGIVSAVKISARNNQDVRKQVVLTKEQTQEMTEQFFHLLTGGKTSKDDTIPVPDGQLEAFLLEAVNAVFARFKLVKAVNVETYENEFTNVLHYFESFLEGDDLDFADTGFNTQTSFPGKKELSALWQAQASQDSKVDEDPKAKQLATDEKLAKEKKLADQNKKAEEKKLADQKKKAEEEKKLADQNKKAAEKQEEDAVAKAAKAEVDLELTKAFLKNIKVKEGSVIPDFKNLSELRDETVAISGYSRPKAYVESKKHGKLAEKLVTVLNRSISKSKFSNANWPKSVKTQWQLKGGDRLDTYEDKAEMILIGFSHLLYQDGTTIGNPKFMKIDNEKGLTELYKNMLVLFLASKNNKIRFTPFLATDGDGTGDAAKDAKHTRKALGTAYKYLLKMYDYFGQNAPTLGERELAKTKLRKLGELANNKSVTLFLYESYKVDAFTTEFSRKKN